MATSNFTTATGTTYNIIFTAKTGTTNNIKNGNYSRTNGNGRTGTGTLNTYTQYHEDSPISRFNSASFITPTN